MSESINVHTAIFESSEHFTSVCKKADVYLLFYIVIKIGRLEEWQRKSEKWNLHWWKWRICPPLETGVAENHSGLRLYVPGVSAPADRQQHSTLNWQQTPSGCKGTALLSSSVTVSLFYHSTDWNECRGAISEKQTEINTQQAGGQFFQSPPQKKNPAAWMHQMINNTYN